MSCAFFFILPNLSTTQLFALGMMQQFVHKYQTETDKQDCLKAVDCVRTTMRNEGKKTNKMNKIELTEALGKLSALKKKRRKN